MKQTIELVLLCGFAMSLGSACSKKEASDDSKSSPESATNTAEGGEPKPPSFDIAGEKVVVTRTLAPNETYAQQGLGLEAPEGKTFVCAFYSVTNAGDEAASSPTPTLLGPDGTSFEVSVQAAGKLPTAWESTHSLSKIEPGAKQAGPACFEVPEAVASEDLELRFAGEGQMGSKADDWEKVVDLPAAAEEDDGSSEAAEDEAAKETE